MTDSGQPGTDQAMWLAQQLGDAADACNAAAARLRDGLPMVAELRAALETLGQVASALAAQPATPLLTAAQNE